MKWYHVTAVNRGESFIFLPFVPRRLQKGEDKRTPRICVTDKWRHSLRSIMIVHLNRFFYVYSCEETPVSPSEMREALLRDRKITRACNDFNLPKDGFINKEHWFLKPTHMVLDGHVRIPEESYASALMGFGMFNYPNPEKLEMVPGLPPETVFF